MPSSPLDSGLIQIVDAALAEATRKSGSWLVCRPGCTDCCMGPFPITQLDAQRLARGLTELETHDPDRAERVHQRAEEAVARISARFPDDPISNLLAAGDGPEDDEPCPALDPTTGTCDLYAFRPITCRAFGPPVRGSEGIGVCELCFHGASEDEIAACEVVLDPDDLEGTLLKALAAREGISGETLVAFALAPRG